MKHSDGARQDKEQDTFNYSSQVHELDSSRSLDDPSRNNSSTYLHQILGPSFLTTRDQPMSLRERFDSIRQRRISKLVEAEVSASGGFIDRTSAEPSLDIQKLQADLEKNQDVTSSTLVRMIKDARPSKVDKECQDEEQSSDIKEHIRASIFSALHLTWKNIKYEVKIKNETKEILHDISGEARPGEMLALMGSSGAGKTTLLNILAGRAATGNISGNILVNGRKRDIHSWKYMIGYVEQEDVMYRTLTVKETLYYAAMLRLPQYLTHEQKKQRATQVMTELGLAKAARTRIGDEFTKGISGGERKRVAIGIELIANPGLLFLDEPTSGLDSYAAYNIMESISVLALRELKTVIATVHQPREDILFLFDKLLLITGGHCAYFGSTVDAMSWFDEVGYACPTFINPADFFIDLISIDTRGEELEKNSLSRINRIVTSWKNHLRDSEPLSITIEGSEAVDNDKQHEDTSIRAFNPDLSMLEPESREKQMLKIMSSSKLCSSRNTWIEEFYILLRRSILHQLRSKAIIVMLLVQTIYIILMIGFTFFQLPLNQPGAQARVGLMLFFIINISFSTIQSVALIFPIERAVIMRERYAGSYRVSSYYVSKAISLLPIRIIAVLTYVWITYYIIGLNPAADRFFILQGIMLDTMFCAYAFGLLIGSLSKTPEHSQIISIMILLTLFIYAGNLVSATIVPPELSWLQYISFMKYAYSAAMQNEFVGLVFLCQNNQPPVNETCSPGFATGEQVLEQYDLTQFSISTSCLIILGMGLAVNVLAYFVLRYSSKPPTKL